MLLRRIIDGIVRRFDWYVRIPLAHKQFERINILNSIDSIKYIIEHKCSVSRFGDGEFIMLLGGGYDDYQGADQKLAKRLKEVLVSTDAPNHIVGLPMPLKHTIGLRPSSRDFWDYFTLRKGVYLVPYLSTSRLYIDTQLSRFYIMYTDKSHCGNQLNLLKAIWNNQDVVIIEGTKSRTGIGNDLYDNVKSLSRILGPATDAFSMYDEMLEAIVKHVSKDNLILLSYGPTATILAYDLAKLGYWAIDIGHLDIEYEWFKMGAIDKVVINGKFTNEAKGGRFVKSNEDKEYLQQIIFDITSIQ
ncbi:MAG: GT-D fold domain-containing glycosyltransferase [Parabacteroides sp.]|nr:GT-D fold domain-containing glycosyltransferase [Parabacteroides sp.]MCI7508569.1 GT-D fold domain-containing glycosyltransferase [Prevotella sp.]